MHPATVETSQHPGLVSRKINRVKPEISVKISHRQDCSTPQFAGRQIEMGRVKCGQESREQAAAGPTQVEPPRLIVPIGPANLQSKENQTQP